MIGMNRHQRAFQVGTRVVSARDRRTGLDDGASFGEMRVETVVDLDLDVVAAGNNARMVLAHAGGTREVRLGYTSIHEEGPWRVVWTDPLPDDDQAALRIVGDLLGLNGGYRRTVLLWIAMREDEISYAHQLWDHDEVTEHAGIPQPVGPFRMSSAPIRIRGLNEMGPGDLIACLHHDAMLENHLYEHIVKNPRTIAYAATPADIPAALPWQRHVRNRNTIGKGDLAGPHAFEEAEDLAWARTQPSEALVAAWEDETAAGRKSVNVSVIDRSGIAFHNNDDPEAYLEHTVPGPGLWKFENARMHSWRSHEGEYDSDIEGDWRPANEQDVLATHRDLTDAGREIVERLDGTSMHLDEDTAVRVMIDLAKASERIEQIA